MSKPLPFSAEAPETLTGRDYMDALGLDTPDNMAIHTNMNGETVPPDVKRLVFHARMTESVLQAVFKTIMAGGADVDMALNAMTNAYGGFIADLMLTHKEHCPTTPDKDREEIITGMADCMRLNALAHYRGNHETKA